MKCREAQHWLLTFRRNASWPADLVRHIQDCPKCQQLHVKLKQIDAGVDTLTAAPGDPSAKDRLMQRVALTPQVAAPVDDAATPAPTPTWRGWQVGAYLVGAAALLAFGFLLGRYGETPDLVDPMERVRTVVEFRDKAVEVFRDKIVTVHSQVDRSLFSALLKHNARLVQASQSVERMSTLLDMADDCRRHALALIEQGPRDSLPLTIDLYGQLLRDGVVVQLVQAAPANRGALQTAARERLEKMKDVPAGASGPLPRVLADQQDALQNATREALEQIDRPEEAGAPSKTRKPGRHEALAPTAALVQFAITVSSEADPVVKADLCADYVQRLMPSMQLYLAEESVLHRADMGQQFGQLIQFGVYAPLEAAAAKQPAPPVKLETERIFEFAAQAVAEMEKNLQSAPAEARPAWEKAIAVTKKSFEMSKGYSKGKGKGHWPKEGKGPRDIQGIIKSVDAGRGTVTVTARIQGRDVDATYSLPKDLLSFLLNQPKTDAIFQSEWQIRLSEDRRTVIELRSRRDRHDDGERNQK
ncbi:MAG: anti-sigma factor [Planctomycetes bacterium]|nr:anti-sigma factor [Planctomycetota bacterium]